MAEKTVTVQKPHHMFLEDRRILTLTGVSDVQNFDEKTVVAVTDHGELTVLGSGLQITRLSLESGDLSLEGRVDSLTYAENRTGKGGFFGRLFR